MIFLAVNHLIIIDMFQTSGSLSRFLHLDIYLGSKHVGGIWYLWYIIYPSDIWYL